MSEKEQQINLTKTDRKIIKMEAEVNEMENIK